MKPAIFVISTLFFLTACGDKQNTDTSQPTPVAVEIMELVNNANYEALTFSGEVKSKQTAQIGTRISGYIEKLPVRLGQKVKQGELLVLLNSRELHAQQAAAQAEVNKAKAAFDNASLNFKRISRLHEQKSASQNELDQATLQFNVAQSQWESAQQNLAQTEAQSAYHQIRAPFNGVVTQKNADVGDMAIPGTPLLAIENPGNQEIIARISARDIEKIQTAQKVQIHADAIGLKTEGEIVEISPSSSLSGGQFMAKVALSEPHPTLLPGMFVRVLAQTPLTGNERIFIPKSALIQQGGLTGIYTPSLSDTAVLRWIRTGAEIEDEVEVISGLSTEDKIIVKAEGKLYNGVAISIK